MKDSLYDASHIVFALIEKAMAHSITFSGEENLDNDNPTIFVANHFTRIETFLLPYVLYKKLNFKVRSLADFSMFEGMLGDYMSAVGSLSTKDKHRDDQILGDLITGRINWLIYPEGSMIKSKKVLLSDQTCLVEDSEGLHNVHTGAAVLALKSEIEKARYFNLENDCDTDAIKDFKEKYFFEEDDEPSYYNTNIVPINMSYSNIRTGKNTLYDLVGKYIESNGDKSKEEAEIESNLLLNSQLHIHFSKPIDAKIFLLNTKNNLVQKGEEFDNETIIEKARLPLTNLMMNEIYKNILITFEHIYALCLEYLGSCEFSLSELKSRIYLVARELRTLVIYRLDNSLDTGLYKLLNDESFELFDDVFKLSLEQNILVHVEKEIYRVDVKNFKNEHTFNTIRLKNILRVLINETIILEELHKTIKKHVQKETEVVNKEVLYIIYNHDQKVFKHDYSKFYSVFESKPKEVGEPFLLYNEKNSIGCVLSHGYKSAPKEIEPLANYLFERGINIYAVRLKGHGTMPEDLKDSTYSDWYDSFDTGYSALAGVSKKLYLCGFSTGGLLALLKASNVNHKVDGVISINTAISLQDIRVKYVVPTINVINNFLSIFNADIDKYESETERPEINYKMIYLSSVGELKKLIDIVKERLPTISEKILIIQADEDPVVNPDSADIVYDNIASSEKEKYIVHSNKHVITLEESVNTEIHEKIFAFIVKDA